MATQTQMQIKALLDEAQVFSDKAQKAGKWEPDEEKLFRQKMDQADALRLTAEAEKKLAELKAWGKESTGSAVVDSLPMMSRPSAPREGGMEVDETGAPLSSRAEKMLKILESRQYRDTLDEYVRAQCKGRAMKGEFSKVMQETVDVAGGNWTVPEFNPNLITKLPAPTGFAANVRTWTTGSNMISFPKVVYNGATDDPIGTLYTTGLRPAIGPEAPNSDFSEATNPLAGRENIEVFTYTLPVIVTRSMIEDAQFDVMGYVSQKISENADLYKKYLFLNGSGISTISGVFSHPNVSVATASGGMLVKTGISAKVTWDGVASGSSGTFDPTLGLIGTEAALPPQYDQGAKWYATKATYASVRSLRDTVGRPMWQVEDSYPNFRTQTPMQLLGYECVKDQFVPALGASTNFMLFGDAGGYYAINRVTFSLEVLKELRALRDEWILYARMRLGGKLVEDWRLKVLNAAS